MINQFALNKALLDKLQSIVIDINDAIPDPNPLRVKPLIILYDKELAEKDINSDYVKESVVPTIENIPLGTGKEVQRGFYQINVCTPFFRGRFYHLAMVDKLRPKFGKGLSAGIEFNGQKVSIYTVMPSPIYSDDTHLKTALTISYTVIA